MAGSSTDKTVQAGIDNAVMDLLLTVTRKKDEIKKAKKRPQWKTNCTFGYNPDELNDRVNIMTVRNPARLIDFYVFLLQKEQFSANAADELGLELDLTWLGYPIADWKADLKSRAAQLSVDKKQKEMEALDKRVNKLVSPDQRREMELKLLQDILND